MRIAIDISPLSNGHQTRGIGFYTENLVRALKCYDKSNSYTFFTRGEKLPENADLIHYPYFDPFFLTLPFKKATKTVVTVHDLIPLVFPNQFPAGLRGGLKWQWQKLSLRGAQAIITDSENSKKDIVKYTGINAEKIHVVYLAAGEEFKKLETGNKYNLPERFVLYVGDINYSKNIPGLIKAFKKLKPQIADLKLVLVGKAFKDENLKETQEILQLIESLGIVDEIVKPGFVPTEDLAAIYNRATVYCQPSFYEGFGLPVLEAMACGCPVIASKTGSLPEVVGDAGILVDPEKTEEISEKLLKLLKLPMEEKQKIREKGFAQSRKFSWKKCAEETVAVYKQAFASQ